MIVCTGLIASAGLGNSHPGGGVLQSSAHDDPCGPWCEALDALRIWTNCTCKIATRGAVRMLGRAGGRRDCAHYTRGASATHGAKIEGTAQRRRVSSAAKVGTGSTIALDIGISFQRS